MNTWKPISKEDFNKLFEEQYNELDDQERKVFDSYKVNIWKGIIRRSEKYGDEYVFIVAQNEDGVLSFDDVEYGFNISTVDENGRILTPGGSQATLKEAIEDWFPV